MLTREAIERYFIAEKQESLLFLVIGIIAILLALLFFFFLKSSFYKGAAIPLIVIGLIQGIVGYTVFSRSDEDRIRNVYAYDMNPGEFREKELPRMEKVNRSFVLYRWIEIVFVVVGVVLILAYRSRPLKTFWLGFGILLAVQALLMLTADFLAEKRAKSYTNEIITFVEEQKG